MDFWSIFRRAFRDTVRFFAENFFGNLRNLLIPLLFIAGTAIHLYRFGWTEAMEEINVFISYGLIPVGGFVVLLFVSNLILAPSRILYEAIGSGNPIKTEKKIIEPVNYAAWDQTNTFKISEVVGFLADGKKGDWVPYNRMIREAAENGELELNIDFPRWQRSRMMKGRFEDLSVDRQKLIEYFEKKGMKPPFLYPEERK